MPFSITSRDISRRMPVQARSQGGYAVAEQSDPNDAIETFRRRQGSVPEGAYTGSQMPNANAANPVLASNGASAFGQNIALMQRAQQASRESDWQDTTSDARRNIVLRDPRWLMLSQALNEAGTDRMATGASRGWEQPGFFDAPSMSALRRF